MKGLINELEISTNEFLFQFQSHPQYPSALAYSDTLNFLGVKNDAYQLEKEYWQELSEEFITIYKNNFSLIKNEGEIYKVISEEVQTVSFENLTENLRKFCLC